MLSDWSEKVIADSPVDTKYQHLRLNVMTGLEPIVTLSSSSAGRSINWVENGLLEVNKLMFLYEYILYGYNT